MAGQPQTINEEAGLGSNWVPVDRSPIIPGQMVSAPPASDFVPTNPKYIQGSIAPSFQHDSSFVDTGDRTVHVPKFDLMPLGPQENAVVSTQISSAVRSVVANIPPAASSGGLSSVGLLMPTQFAVTNSPLTSNGNIAVSWIAEQPGTYLGVGSVANQPFPDVTVANASPTTSTTLSLTTIRGSLVFYAAAVQFTNSISTAGLAPTGGTWTNLVSGGSTYAAFQQFSSGAVVSEAPNYTSSSGTESAIAAAMVEFGVTGTPTFAVLTSAGGAGTTITAGPATPSAGQVLIALVQETGQIKNVVSIVDTQNNSWFRITDVSALVSAADGTGAKVSIWFCPAPAAASTSFTAVFSGLATATNFIVYKATNFSASSGIPTFRYISFSDISGGVVSVANGGTGANLALTGGINKFVSQGSAGGPFSVVQPDYNNMAGVNPATSYNNQALVSTGLPSEVAQVDLTSQSASVGPTTVLTPGVSGMYRISWSAKVTTAATVSSTLGGTTGLQITYTDNDDSVTVLTSAWQGGDNNGAAPTAASGNTTQTQWSGVIVVNAKAANAIRYSFGYTSSGATVMKYSLHIKIESM